MFYYYIPFIFALLSLLKKDRVHKYFTAFLIFIYLFLLVVLRGNTSADYEAYQNRFTSNLSLNLIDNYDSFSLLTAFFNSFGLGTFRVLIFSFGLITFSLLYHILFVKNKYVFITLLYYYSYLFFVQPVSAMKAGVSSLFFLLAVLFFYEKKIKLSYFIFLLSVLFHPSALIGIVVFNKYFIKEIKIYVIFLSCVFAFFAGKYFFSEVVNYLTNADFGFITSKSAGYLEATENEVGTRTANIFLIVITLKLIFNILLRGWFKTIKIESTKELYLLNIQFFAILAYYFCFSLPVVAARFYELIGVVEIIIITFPILIFKEKFIIKLLIFALIFFQFYITINLLGGEIVKPYNFFFI